MGCVNCRDVCCSGSVTRKCCSLRLLKRFIPIVNWLPKYKLSYLKDDLIAGIAVGLTLVPQALALAQVTRLPFEYGLYSSFIGLFVYTIFGTSKDVAIGPSNLLSMFVGQFMMQFHASTPVYTCLMSLFCGLVLFFMGLLRLDFLVNMFSIPVVCGFTTASGLIIIINQLSNLFGFFSRGGTPWEQILLLVKMFTKMNFIDVGTGSIGIVFLIIVERLPKFSAKRFVVLRNGCAGHIMQVLCASRITILVLLGILFSFVLTVLYPDVEIVTKIGPLPARLPAPSPPRFVVTNESLYFNETTIAHENIVVLRSAWQVLSNDLVIPFVVVPLMVMFELLLITKSLARKNRYRFNSSQELIAVGLANIVGSFFYAFPITAAPSRSAINDQCRAATPLAGSISAVVVILAACFLNSFLFYIPRAILASFVVSAGISFFDLATFMHVWHEWRWDLLPLLATFIVSISSTMWQGLSIGLIISFVILIYRAVRVKVVAEHISTTPPPVQEMHLSSPPKASPATNASVNIPFHTPPSMEDETSPPVNRIVIIRLQQGLYYPSVDRFADRMSKILAKGRGHIIVDCQFLTGLDFTALQGIRQVLLLAFHLNRPLVFARLNDNLRKRIELLDSLDHFRHAARWDEVLADDPGQDVDGCGGYGDISSVTSLNGSVYGDNNIDAMFAKRSALKAEDLTPIAEEASEQSIEAVVALPGSPKTPAVQGAGLRASPPKAVNSANLFSNSLASASKINRVISEKLMVGQLAYEPHFFGPAIPLAVGTIALDSLTAERSKIRGFYSVSQGSPKRIVTNQMTAYILSDDDDDSEDDNDYNDDDDSDLGGLVLDKQSTAQRRLRKNSTEHVELLEFTAKSDRGQGTGQSLRKPISSGSKETSEISRFNTHVSLEKNSQEGAWPSDPLMSSLARSLSHHRDGSRSASNSNASRSIAPNSVECYSTVSKGPSFIKSSDELKIANNSLLSSSGACPVVVVHSSTDNDSLNHSDRDKIDNF